MKTLTILQIQVKKMMAKNDPAHDFEHVLRVYANAEKICMKEKIEKKLVLTATLLHDIVSFPKTDKRSKTSSTKSAIKAKKILQEMNFMTRYLNTLIC